GSLTLSGTTTIQITPLGPLNGGSPYTIMYGQGGLTGGAPNLHGVSAEPPFKFTPRDAPPHIPIRVHGNARPMISKSGKAPAPNAWDHTTTNWFNTSSLANEIIYNGDIAVFDDSASTNIVNIVGTNNPSTIATSNNATPFTFVGGGLLVGALDIEGTGSL